jgi:hypothetical protein
MAPLLAPVVSTSADARCTDGLRHGLPDPGVAALGPVTRVPPGASTLVRRQRLAGRQLISDRE